MGLYKFLLCHKYNDICVNWKWEPKQIEGFLKSFNAFSIRRTSFTFDNMKIFKNIFQFIITFYKQLNLIKQTFTN